MIKKIVVISMILSPSRSECSKDCTGRLFAAGIGPDSYKGDYDTTLFNKINYCLASTSSIQVLNLVSP